MNRPPVVQNDRPVLDHVIGLLRSLGIGSTVPVFPAAASQVAVEVDDTTTAEPLGVSARCERPDAALSCVLERVDGLEGPRVVPLVQRNDASREAVGTICRPPTTGSRSPASACATRRRSLAWST